MCDVKEVVIACPSLDLSKNIGGISSVAGFVIKHNNLYHYTHFEIGKYDNEKRSLSYAFRIARIWSKWFFLMIFSNGLLVHFNFALEKRAIIRDSPLILFAQLMKKPLVLHVHGGLYLDKEDIPHWVRYMLEWILGSQKPKIVLSNTEKDTIIRKYNARNVHVLPNSADIGEALNFKKNFGAKSILTLLYIGRITKAKGIEYIYKALKELKRNMVPFRFILAGNGEDKEEYLDKFSGTFGDDFEYRGVVCGIEKTRLLKESDVFILPSLYEGLPVALLECMAYSIVPLVTDVGSVKSVVEDGKNGIILGMHSFEDISDAIMRFHNDESLLERLGANAQRSIFEKFNPENYINTLNKIYELA